MDADTSVVVDEPIAAKSGGGGDDAESPKPTTTGGGDVAATDKKEKKKHGEHKHKHHHKHHHHHHKHHHHAKTSPDNQAEETTKKADEVSGKDKSDSPVPNTPPPTPATVNEPAPPTTATVPRADSGSDTTVSTEEKHTSVKRKHKHNKHKRADSEEGEEEQPPKKRKRRLSPQEEAAEVKHELDKLTTEIVSNAGGAEHTYTGIVPGEVRKLPPRKKKLEAIRTINRYTETGAERGMGITREEEEQMLIDDCTAVAADAMNLIKSPYCQCEPDALINTRFGELTAFSAAQPMATQIALGKVAGKLGADFEQDEVLIHAKETEREFNEDREKLKDMLISVLVQCKAAGIQDSVKQASLIHCINDVRAPLKVVEAQCRSNGTMKCDFLNRCIPNGVQPIILRAEINRKDRQDVAEWRVSQEAKDQILFIEDFWKWPVVLLKEMRKCYIGLKATCTEKTALSKLMIEAVDAKLWNRHEQGKKMVISLLITYTKALVDKISDMETQVAAISRKRTQKTKASAAAEHQPAPKRRKTQKSSAPVVAQAPPPRVAAATPASDASMDDDFDTVPPPPSNVSPSQQQQQQTHTTPPTEPESFDDFMPADSS